MKVYIICYILAQIAYLERSGSLDIGQNSLDQSDCRVLKLNISLEQNEKNSQIFCMLRKIHGN